jgi:hypothetical protein
VNNKLTTKSLYSKAKYNSTINKNQFEYSQSINNLTINDDIIIAIHSPNPTSNNNNHNDE